MATSVVSPIVSSPTVWLTLPEAARYSRVARITIQRALRDGDLVGYRLNNRKLWRFRQADLDHWITGSPKAGA